MNPFHASKFLSFVRRCADNAILADEMIRRLLNGGNQRKGKLKKICSTASHIPVFWLVCLLMRPRDAYSTDAALNQEPVPVASDGTFNHDRFFYVETSNVYEFMRLCWLRLDVSSDTVSLEWIRKLLKHHAATHEYRLFIEHPVGDQPNRRIFPTGCQDRPNA